MEEVENVPFIKKGLKGVELAKAVLKMQRFISEYLTKGGTIEELEKMGYKFGTLDISNLRGQKP